jgi:hypothetical protein
MHTTAATVNKACKLTRTSFEFIPAHPVRCFSCGETPRLLVIVDWRDDQPNVAVPPGPVK